MDAFVATQLKGKTKIVYDGDSLPMFELERQLLRLQVFSDGHWGNVGDEATYARFHAL